MLFHWYIKLNTLTEFHSMHRIYCIRRFSCSWKIRRSMLILNLRCASTMPVLLSLDVFNGFLNLSTTSVIFQWLLKAFNGIWNLLVASEIFQWLLEAYIGFLKFSVAAYIIAYGIFQRLLKAFNGFWNF